MKKILLCAALAVSTPAFSQSYVTTAGVKQVLIEESTGAWCGFCPDGAYTLDTLLATHPRVVAISIHDNINTYRGDQTSDDMMEVPTGYDYNHTSGLGGGYPSGSVDRVPDIIHHIAQNRMAWSNASDIALNDTVKFDVDLKHNFNPATGLLTVWVTAKALMNLTGRFNVNAAITEDSIASVGAGYEQHSHLFRDYTSHFYHVGTPNSDTSDAILGPSVFAQRHVLRGYLGGVFGDTAVITDNPAAGTTYTKQYTFFIPAGFRKQFVHIVGFVQRYDVTNLLNRRIENVVEARLDSTALPSIVENAGAIENSIKVFPIPASDYFEISADYFEGNMASINITNVIGETVFEKDYPINGAHLSARIDAKELSEGTYIARVYSGRQCIVRRLVVRH